MIFFENRPQNSNSDRKLVMTTVILFRKPHAVSWQSGSIIYAQIPLGQSRHVMIRHAI